MFLLHFSLQIFRSGSHLSGNSLFPLISQILFVTLLLILDFTGGQCRENSEKEELSVVIEFRAAM